MDREYRFWGWETADIRPVSNDYPAVRNPRDMYDVLMKIWCSDTCAPRMRERWSTENPTLGQCSITAFLVQNVFGGRVYGIPLEDGGFHLYNVVGDCAFDLTSEQFEGKTLNYSNNPEQFRETHFAKEEKRLRYEYLKSEFERLAGNHSVNKDATSAPVQPEEQEDAIPAPVQPEEQEDAIPVPVQPEEQNASACTSEHHEMKASEPSCYAARTRDSEILKASSSGGVFTELALDTIKAGGVVYGVAMTADCRGAEYVRVTDAKGLEALRGSKYIEASSGQAFRQVEQDLCDGRRVLFSGTPCKIMGLEAFLKTDFALLLKVAVVCHGTADEKLWNKYADACEKKRRSKLAGVSFRSKKYGWGSYGMELEFTDGSVRTKTAAVDEFHRLYRRNAALKKICYECPAKAAGCHGDIQLGDLWGAGRIAPALNDDLGASCVLCYTDTGREALQNISRRLELLPAGYEELIKYNPMIAEAVKRPTFFKTFREDMETMGLEELARKYAPVPFRSRISAILKRIR